MTSIVSSADQIAACEGMGMEFEHRYAVRLDWQGNLGTGTSGYREYARDTLATAEGKPPIDGSSDRPFRGSPERWNPEDLLVMSLSQCHLLSYLHVAVNHRIVVEAYEDDAIGTMLQTADGGGHFTSVTLRPVVTISAGDPDLALAIHREASEKCFIASSVNFPVGHEPRIVVAA
jgi:organic hydroperoxide reductase OsmC/OhrA